MSNYTNREILAEPTFPKVPQPVKGMSYLEVLLYSNGVYGEKSGRWLGSSRRPGAVLLTCPCALAIQLKDPYESEWFSLATEESMNLENISDEGDDDIQRNLEREKDGRSKFKGSYEASGDSAATVKSEIIDEDLNEGYRKITRTITPGNAVGLLWAHFSRLLAENFSMPYEQNGEEVTLFGIPKWNHEAEPTLENYVNEEDEETFKEGTSDWLKTANAKEALVFAEYEEAAEVTTSFGVEGTDGITRWNDVNDEYVRDDVNGDGIITETEWRPWWIKEKVPTNKKDYDSGGALTVQGEYPYPDKTFPISEMTATAKAYLNTQYLRSKTAPVLISLHGYQAGDNILLPIVVRGDLNITGIDAEKNLKVNVKLQWWPTRDFWINLWPTIRKLASGGELNGSINVVADTSSAPMTFLLNVTVPESRLIYLSAEFYVSPLITQADVTALAEACECTITETRTAPETSWRTSYTNDASMCVTLNATATVNLADIRPL
jgi:hypothetical protein